MKPSITGILSLPMGAKGKGRGHRSSWLMIPGPQREALRGLGARPLFRGLCPFVYKKLPAKTGLAPLTLSVPWLAQPH